MQSGLHHDIEKFTREESFVRGLARALCSDGAIDADDVAQQAWLNVLEHGGDGVAEPRSWLGRTVRNVASNLARAEGRRHRREQRAADSAGTAPSSIELVQREERRREVVRAVDGLPPRLREIVLLRWFEGLSPRAIAVQLGLPAARVHDLHRRALERLRAEVDIVAQKNERLDRRAFLGPLALAGHRATKEPVPAGVWLSGVLAMTTKTKAIAIAAALLMGIAAYLGWTGSVPHSLLPEVVEPGVAAQSARVESPVPPTREPVAAATAADRDVMASTPAVALGSLLVSAVHASDEPPGPAADIAVKVVDTRRDQRGALRSRTDEAGSVRFEGLDPGRYYVWADRFGPTRTVNVEAGEQAEVELRFEHGMLLQGRVIDLGDRPIAGAVITCGMPGLVGRDPEVLAISDERGEFVIRSAPVPSVLSARRSGFLAGPMQLVMSDSGETEQVQIRLQPGGATVTGIVYGPDDEPVPNALVKLGEGRVQGVTPMSALGSGVLPALERTDAEGRFAAAGFAAGEHPVVVRAGDYALWTGVVTVATFGTASLRIDLQRAATLHGRAVDAAGLPVAGARISRGGWDDFGRREARSAQNGYYELGGLSGGDVEVHAEHEDAGKADAQIYATAGERTELDLLLSRGLELTGSITDQHGKPVEAVLIELVVHRREGLSGWMNYTRSDDEGNFAIANCPSQQDVSLKFGKDEIEPLRLSKVDPRAGPLAVRVLRIPPPNATIRGRVIGPDGLPVAGVQVRAWNQTRAYGSHDAHSNAEGRFEFASRATGDWHISVRSDDFPDVSGLNRELGSNDVWDLGDVRLCRGGCLVLRTAPGTVPVTDLRCMVVARDSKQRWSLARDKDPITSAMLVPGDYVAQIWSPGAAAQSLPFSIRAGVNTELQVEVQPGVLVVFEFEDTDPEAPSSGVSLQVERDGTRLVDQWLSFRDPGSRHYEVALEPGAYRARAGGGTTEFRVTEGMSPVRVVVQ